MGSVRGVHLYVQNADAGLLFLFQRKVKGLDGGGGEVISHRGVTHFCLFLQPPFHRLGCFVHAGFAHQLRLQGAAQ